MPLLDRLPAGFPRYVAMGVVQIIVDVQDFVGLHVRDVNQGVHSIHDVGHASVGHRQRLFRFFASGDVLARPLVIADVAVLVTDGPGVEGNPDRPSFLVAALYLEILKAAILSQQADSFFPTLRFQINLGGDVGYRSDQFHGGFIAQDAGGMAVGPEEAPLRRDLIQPDGNIFKKVAIIFFPVLQIGQTPAEVMKFSDKLRSGFSFLGHRRQVSR